MKGSLGRSILVGKIVASDERKRPGKSRRAG
jgi:hypothetical protein